MKKIFLTLLMLVSFILVGCISQETVNGQTQDEVAPNVDGDLKISMLNVAHGDSILIRTNEQTILVDTGHFKERTRFVNELEKLSVTKIDKLILTHPHGDHIGNASIIINPSAAELEDNPYLKNISVVEVYDNGIPSASPLYKSYMQAIIDKGITRRSLTAGDTVDFGNGVSFNVLFPTAEFVATINDRQFDKKDKAYDRNNQSIVGKLVYKNFSMMFTGDCEKESEAKLVASNAAEILKCDVLKAGHHGISTSSKTKFIAAVNPGVVLISAGNREKDNKAYGQPHRKPLETYLAQGIDANNIYCTRWNGTITITSDGENFSVQPEHREEWVTTWLARKEQLRQERRQLEEEENNGEED